MNTNIIFKPTTDNLKNAIAAIVGRAIRSIKRFTTALHNKCNLVVYVDEQGRTCCQFLKKDAFSGYHFAFSSNECLVTNKESGEIYTVNFSLAICTCPAYKYDRTKPCKHIRMVAELRGDLENAVLKTQKECTHPKAMIGLDAHYCPDCKKSIKYGTDAYEEILNRDKKPPTLGTKTITRIDPNLVPSGCRLSRTDDHISMEYDVWAWGYKNIRGVKNLIQNNIGRIVHYPDGIYAYRVRSGVARTFQTTTDAIAYLVQVVGTSFEEIAAAFEERMEFKKKVARL